MLTYESQQLACKKNCRLVIIVVSSEEITVFQQQISTTAQQKTMVATWLSQIIPWALERQEYTLRCIFISLLQEQNRYKRADS